jgi:putative phosphoesterase
MRAPTTSRRSYDVGVISDTHGLIRPEALAALAGSQLIVHAGDIGSPDVLTALTAIAPVAAVRGNNDRGDWAQRLTDTTAVQAGDAWLTCYTMSTS